MKYIRNILIIALALLAQSTVFGRFTVLGVRPDLPILVLIFLVNGSGHAESIIYGFLIGFLQDVYSPEFLGINSFIMSLMAYILDNVRERLTIENFSVKTGEAFLACIVHDILLLSFYTGMEVSIMQNLFFRESLPGAVYTSGLLFIAIVVWDFGVSGGLNFVIQGLFGSRR